MPGGTAWLVWGAINLVAFLAMGLDKVLARRQTRRIPEAWLFFWGGAGVGVGAWLGMATFRHKTRKFSFKLQLALATGLGGAVWWLFLWGPWALSGRS